MFSDFENDGKMWTGEGARMRRKKIKFNDAFKQPPSVQVSISMWDMDQDRNQRADIMAEKITEVGFDVVFRTWGDTKVARVRVDWMAIGEVPHGDEWELY